MAQLMRNNRPFRHPVNCSFRLTYHTPILRIFEMQSRFLLHVLFALSSLISSKAQDVMGSGHSCLRVSPADDGHTRVTFLRADTGGVRSLYLSLWSEDARLVACEVNASPLITERYRALCDRGGNHGQEMTRRFNISMLLAPDAPCALVSYSEPKFAKRTRRDGTEAKTRRKRAWLFPGTLWCGTGNKAVGYEQLGMFESADKCCREHDHCKHFIPAFTVNYGVFNSKFFTVSHCDCDQRFRQCLLDVNDTISSMVGYSFFNILQIPCFELKQEKRCTQMYWWGMCKVAKVAPYAVFKTPLPYNTTDNTNKCGDITDCNQILEGSEGQQVTESPMTTSNRESTKDEHRCRSRDPPRGDTFHRRRTKAKGCKRRQKLYTASSTEMPSISTTHTPTPSMKTTPLHVSKSSTLIVPRKGKKTSTRKGLRAHPTQRSQPPSQVTTNSWAQTTKTTQSTPSQLTAVAAVTKSRKSHKEVKKSRCCGLRTPLKGDAFQPHCKNCLDQKKIPHTTTVTPSASTYGPPIKVRTPEKTTETLKQDTLGTLVSSAPPAAPASTELQTAATINTKDNPQKQMDSHQTLNYTSQEPVGRAHTQDTHVERGLTGQQFLCRSLRHLDECKYKIPPLEKKYGLQNKELKTAYHCGCTRRLAVQIESSKQPSVLPALLMDFVSPYCFKLPKEKKCHSRKSCSGGFTKASDLLQALKKIEEKDSAGVRNSGNNRKRGIPVRLYKRCLRLERGADIMAQLTRL